MRLSKLLIGILLFIGSATYAQHSPQDTLTAYYYRYPQQAIKDAEALYRQAIKNNDTPLLIKSLILKTTFTLAIDHEDYPAILSEVEKYLSQETDSAGIAVINSYCAQLYAEYYNNNSYLINQRTPVTDYIPEDIASWSSNIFAEKIKKCVAASLLPARKLQETPLSTYKAILTSLTPADSLRPTLYDFLCYRAINILLQTIFRFSFTIRSGRRIYRHSYSRRTKRAVGYHFADMARITPLPEKTSQSPGFPGYRSGPSGICQKTFFRRQRFPLSKSFAGTDPKIHRQSFCHRSDG